MNRVNYYFVIRLKERLFVSFRIDYKVKLNFPVTYGFWSSLVSQMAGDVPIIGPLAKGINAVANFTDAHEMAQQQRLQQQQPQLMETRQESSGSGRHRYRGGGILLN